MAAVHRINGVSALLVICGFLATGCAQARPTGPSAALDQQFILRPGQLAAIEGTAMRVQFVEVINDSRCPLNAICITAGDASIAVLVVDDQDPADTSSTPSPAVRARRIATCASS